MKEELRDLLVCIAQDLQKQAPIQMLHGTGHHPLHSRFFSLLNRRRQLRELGELRTFIDALPEEKLSLLVELAEGAHQREATRGEYLILAEGDAFGESFVAEWNRIAGHLHKLELQKPFVLPAEGPAIPGPGLGRGLQGPGGIPDFAALVPPDLMARLQALPADRLQEVLRIGIERLISEGERPAHNDVLEQLAAQPD